MSTATHAALKFGSSLDTAAVRSDAISSAHAGAAAFSRFQSAIIWLLHASASATVAWQVVG